MRVAYTKIGRTQAYDPQNWGVAGGDWEAPILVNRLARAYPEVEFVLVGHNDGAVPGDVGLPPNVVNPFVDLREDVRRAERVINVEGTPPVENSLTYIGYMRKIWDEVLNSCDHIIIWMGQNDTINQPIPKVDGTQGLGASRMIYIRCVSYIFSWLNAWREQDPHNREPIWLCSDIWNMLKGRDLAWPQRSPVVSQYNFTRKQAAYRYGLEPFDPSETGWGDVARLHSKHPGCWEWDLRYEYAGLELGSCVPDAMFQYNDQWEGRRRLGVMINQSRAVSGRDAILKEWIRPTFPDWIIGNWDEGRAPDIKPYPWHSLPQLLGTVRSTLAIPIKLTMSWATPKAWEMFAAGTVCFFHPKYDDQGHILPTLRQCDELEREGRGEHLVHLARWLRVKTPAELRKRVDHLNTNQADWEWLVQAQRAVYNVAREENLCLNRIGQMMGMSQDTLRRPA